MSGASLAHRLVDRMAIECTNYGPNVLYVAFKLSSDLKQPHWYICYIIPTREFRPAWHYREKTSTRRAHPLPARLHDVLVSRIPPHILARCIAASLSEAFG